MLLAALGCRDDAGSPTESTPPSSPTDVAAATTLAFRQLSAGWEYTCGVTTHDVAWCWGNEFPGTLGNGSQGEQFCMDWENCVTQPVAVVGGLRFRSVSTGNGHTCGVTTDDRAYCWGNNSGGQLGIGTAAGPDTCWGNESQVSCSSLPVAVRGGLRFRTVITGWGFHSCGLTTDGLAYCWGSNSSGQLGDGTTSQRLTPRAVAGGRRFRLLSAGFAFTCGVTTEDWAYCWGNNDHGQLGDSTRVAERVRPVRVAGGRRFRQLDTGPSHTCAIASDRAFCWGGSDDGQLGTGGSPSKRFWPSRVSGGLSLRRITAGSRHTCGEATDNRAYCWGDNWYGQLGDGTRTQRLTPVAVAGGWLFSQVTAGGTHTCGRTAAALAYCWGENSRGELGDGTTSNRQTPTPVAGPL